jgi:hypothetical protein
VVDRTRMGSNKYPLATLSMRVTFKVCWCSVKGSVRWTVVVRCLRVCVCFYSR